MGPKKSTSSSSLSSHSARAAAILASARKAANSPSKTTKPPAKSSSSSSNESSSQSDPSLDSPISLQSLMSHISTSTQLSMRDAMALSAKLIKSKRNTVNKLTKLSPFALEESGIDPKSDNGKKVLAAFRGKKAAGLKQSSKPSKFHDPFQIPTTSSSSKSSIPKPEVELDYIFNETLEEDSLVGKFALVNRAPVMAAWAMIVLERLGFNRSEALSLAQCYVSQTSHARGVSIGVISKEQAAKRSRDHLPVVGNNQPHFELMGVKIPVMKLHSETVKVNQDGEEEEGGEWRGIDAGKAVGPERAFNYLKKSMAQTLPQVIGGMSLLADSYLNPLPSRSISGPEIKSEEEDLKPSIEDLDSKPNLSSSEEEEVEDPSSYGSEILHQKAYSLYCNFRPETGGQWGKKSRFEIDRLLSLRRGRENEAREWEERHRNGGEVKEEEIDLEAQEMEREAERIVREEESKEREREREANEREIQRVKREREVMEVERDW